MATKKKSAVKKRATRKNPGWIQCKGVRVLKDSKGRPIALQVKK